MTPTLHEKIFRDFFVSKKFILYSFVIHNQKKKKTNTNLIYDC